MLTHFFEKCMVGALAVSLSVILTIGFVPEPFIAKAQQEAREGQGEEPARARPVLRMKAKQAEMAKLTRFCPVEQAQTISRGQFKTYICPSEPTSAPGNMTVAADPDVAKSKINCDYSESGGQTTWLGCTCTADEGGNCNTFITNCIEDGDTVSGNSGGASCSPTE